MCNDPRPSRNWNYHFLRRVHWRTDWTVVDGGDVVNDRELLELAAHAINREIIWSSPFVALGDFLQVPDWNPLTDDGDALNLAVKLGISIEPYPIYAEEKHSVIAKQRHKSDQMRENNPNEVVELYGQDALAATRRAIVRAAAEIGRSM